MKPCPIPRCAKPIGPNGILCRDHYTAVPLYWRKPLNRARRENDKAAERTAARKCIESAGGPS